MALNIREPEAFTEAAVKPDLQSLALTAGGAKGGRFGLVVLLTYAIVRSIAAALSKPLWNDELCTWIMVHLSGPTAVWHALQHAADGNPPAFYLIEKLFSRIVGNELIAFRIAPLIGYCCALFCVYAFIKRKTTGPYAVFCTAILLLTAIDGFPAEARPYSLVIACVAFAMLCYQHAPSLPWMIGMGLSLALSQSLHYYAIFAVIPFGMAEAAVTLKAKTIRFAVWIALAAGFVPLIVFWPLVSAFRGYMGPHFWSQPSLLGVTQTYGEFLHVPPYIGISVFAAVGLGVLGIMVFENGDSGRTPKLEEVSLQEYTLTLALLGLPFLVFVVTRLAHGGMTERYSLPAILALPIAISYIFRGLNGKSISLLVSFVCVALVFQELSFWQGALPQIRRLSSPAAPLERLVNSVGHSELPVVISAGINYLAIDHYASAGMRDRFVVLLDRQKEIANTGSDSLDAQFLVLRNYAPLHAYDLSVFVSKHPAFLLYSHKNAPLGDWWPTELSREGYLIQLLAVDQAGRIYLVTPKVRRT